MENRSGAPNQPLRDSLALYDLALRSFLGPCLHCNRGPLSIEEAGRPGISPEAEPGARQRSGTPATDQKPRRNACDPPVEQAGAHRGAGRECRSRSVRAPASSRSYGTQPASSTEIQGYSVITSRTAADGQKRPQESPSRSSSAKAKICSSSLLLSVLHGIKKTAELDTAVFAVAGAGRDGVTRWTAWHPVSSGAFDWIVTTQTGFLEI